jgi:hypothetical protein
VRWPSESPGRVRCRTTDSQRAGGASGSPGRVAPSQTSSSASWQPPLPASPTIPPPPLNGTALDFGSACGTVSPAAARPPGQITRKSAGRRNPLPNDPRSRRSRRPANRCRHRRRSPDRSCATAKHPHLDHPDLHDTIPLPHPAAMAYEAARSRLARASYAASGFRLPCPRPHALTLLGSSSALLTRRARRAEALLPTTAITLAAVTSEPSALADVWHLLGVVVVGWPLRSRRVGSGPAVEFAQAPCCLGVARPALHSRPRRRGRRVGHRDGDVRPLRWPARPRGWR